MSARRPRRSAAFSLVELLSATLVLGVLSSLAVPLYSSQRQSAAGRVCKANETAIAKVATAWVLRHGEYPAKLDDLLGAPESLAWLPKCPLGGDYVWRVDETGSATITCPNAARHVGFGGVHADEWTTILAAPRRDMLP
ncbi:MAG: hypothetical protein GX446_19015 [Chthonomonadales bacterium]|nr:hypothetical protein [Chthonomonadales bacterium]